MAYLIRMGALEGYLDLLEEMGFNAAPVLRQVGLKKRLFDNYDALISHTLAASLLETTAREYDIPHIGILLSERRRGLVLGMVGMLCRQSPDVGTALHKAMKYIHLHNQVENWEVRKVGEEAYIIRHVLDPDAAASIQMREMAMGDALKFIHLVCGKLSDVQRICVTHPAPISPQIYKKIMKTPVEFNQNFNGIVCRKALLDQKIDTLDADIQRHFDHHLATLRAEKNNNIVDQTRQLIWQTMAMHDSNINNVASLLAMHKRSLQKKLAEQGTSFSQLQDEIRWQQAIDLLRKPDTPLSTMASLLGFSELSAFSRAFRHKFGVSPRQWRQDHTH